MNAEQKIAAILLLLAHPLEFYREAIEYGEVGDEYIEEITKMLINPEAMFEVVKVLADG